MVGSARDQDALEREYYRLAANTTLSPEQQAAVFGEFDRWVLELDGHRLFLNPYQGEWFVYDRVHDTWESTGYRPGAVRFVVQGSRVAAVHLSPPVGGWPPETGADDRNPLLGPDVSLRGAGVGSAGGGRARPEQSRREAIPIPSPDQRPPNSVIESRDAVSSPALAAAPSSAPESAAFCEQCGTRLLPDARFCEGCGAPGAGAPSPAPPAVSRQQPSPTSPEPVEGRRAIPSPAPSAGTSALRSPAAWIGAGLFAGALVAVAAVGVVLYLGQAPAQPAVPPAAGQATAADAAAQPPAGQPPAASQPPPAATAPAAAPQAAPSGPAPTPPGPVVYRKQVTGEGAIAIADFKFSIAERDNGFKEGWLIHAVKNGGPRFEASAIESVEVVGRQASVWGKAAPPGAAVVYPFNLVLAPGTYRLDLFAPDGTVLRRDEGPIVGGATNVVAR